MNVRAKLALVLSRKENASLFFLPLSDFYVLFSIRVSILPDRVIR